jgi:hypothetical protein
MMLLELCLGVIVFKTCSFITQSHFTLTALDENFLCHSPGHTHVTPLLRLRRDRPIFAAEFESSDV